MLKKKVKKSKLGKMKMMNGGRNFNPYDKKKAIETGAHYGRKANSSSSMTKYG